MGEDRNASLDYLKGIACILVVFLHFPTSNKYLNFVIDNLAYFAVPLFFMISGFYAYSKIQRPQYYIRKAIRTGRLFLFAVVLYLVWGGIQSHQKVCFLNGLPRLCSGKI